MAEFNKAYDRTARFEGGYTDISDDNGNWTGGKKGIGALVGTNFGITAPELMHHLRRIPTVDDMKHISLDLVKSIYEHNYWKKIRGDEINNQDEANMLYDSAVNMGVRTAIILAQRSLRIIETGIMDNHTLNLINNK